MTQEKIIKQLNALSNGESIIINNHNIKKMNTRWIVKKGKSTKNYQADELGILAKILVGNNDIPAIEIGEPFSIADTELIGIKTHKGFDIWHKGKKLESGLSNKQYEDYIEYYKNETEVARIEKAELNIKKEVNMTKRKKVLYFFIILISVILLSLTFILGVRYDGVKFSRKNQALYDTIQTIADAKVPERQFDKFDEIYYTLLYHAHKKHFFMLDDEVDPETGDIVIDRTVLDNTYIYEITQTDLRDKSNDKSLSGVDFNAYFQDREGLYVKGRELYRRIGLIMDYELKHDSDVDYLTQIVLHYLIWDKDDLKSNIAYNYDSREFDRDVDHYNDYFRRNTFFKLFLNNSSKFVNEYNMFEMVGWLNWTSIIILFLYIILAICIWLFRRDNMKVPKPLIIIISSLLLIIMIPLIIQYLFEGLTKDPNTFLDVVENTRFTSTTTVMNFVFNIIIKFSNILFTGIVTIALPLKVIRYFVMSKITKLENKALGTTMITPDTVIRSRNINPTYGGGR